MRNFVSVLLFMIPLCVLAQTDASVEIKGTFYKVDKDGSEESDDVNGTTQSAPIRVVFETILGEGTGISDVKWVVYHDEKEYFGQNVNPLDYTFTESGTYRIELLCNYTFDGQTLKFPEEYDGDYSPITFSVSESKLEFPNAFSPNGDGYNDVLRAKDDYQSIVSFEAAVFNRWGNKIYSWNDVRGEWDGTFNGKTVKDGVYFLVVNAKGADGREFKIKKTITVVTGYNNGEGKSSNVDE